METSTSHKDVNTGILDKNGCPIMKTSVIKVTDTYKNQEVLGKVVWKNGSYVFKPLDLKKNKYYSEYNIYAWRKSIEVVDSDGNCFFDEKSMEEAMERWGRKELTFMTPTEERKKFFEGFELGYKARIEHEFEKTN